MKHAVMAVLDLDVEILDYPKPAEVERLTASKVRTGLENSGKGIKVKMLRTKFLGLSEKLPGGE
jgi:hypothetical protein